MTTEQKMQVEIEVCIKMLREAFQTLNTTAKYYQISPKEIDSFRWNSLIKRIKKYGFYYIGQIRCITPANISDFIREIEEIRLKIERTGFEKKYQ